MLFKTTKARPLAALAGAGLLLLTTAPARADFVPSLEIPAPPNLVEQQLLTNNPALAELATTNPWLLRYALNSIAASGPESRDGGSIRIDPAKLTNGADLRILDANPALRDLWRTTPDAATALLSLIRAAASSAALSSAR